jgi:hypothetical protein
MGDGRTPGGGMFFTLAMTRPDWRPGEATDKAEPDVFLLISEQPLTQPAMARPEESPP